MIIRTIKSIWYCHVDHLHFQKHYKSEHEDINILAHSDVFHLLMNHGFLETYVIPYSCPYDSESLMHHHEECCISYTHFLQQQINIRVLWDVYHKNKVSHSITTFDLKLFNYCLAKIRISSLLFYYREMISMNFLAVTYLYKKIKFFLEAI